MSVADQVPRFASSVDPRMWSERIPAPWWIFGLILLLLVQLTELRGAPPWVGLALALGWIGLLLLFFTWAPWQIGRAHV